MSATLEITAGSKVRHLVGQMVSGPVMVVKSVSPTGYVRAENPDDPRDTACGPASRFVLAETVAPVSVAESRTRLEKIGRELWELQQVDFWSAEHQATFDRLAGERHRIATELERAAQAAKAA